MTPVSATSQILVLSGLPGAGKSHYTRWLTHKGWGAASWDDLATDSESPMTRAVIDAFRGHDEDLLALAAPSRGFVLEWGFPAGWLEVIQAMIGRGYRTWYFDGDRDTALRARQRTRRERGESDDPTPWLLQVEGLDQRRSEIEETYAGRITTTALPRDRYLSVAQIDAIIFGR